jgi:hypothetical protein
MAKLGCRGGKEMADGGGVLGDYVRGKNASDTLILYLVVRFPGASFALPSDEDRWPAPPL